MAGAKQPFTLERANRVLPLIRVIVKDLVAKRREYQRLEREMAKEKDERKRAHLEEDLDGLRTDIERAVEEISELGASMKDLEMGLVDFPAKLGAKPVYLCWRLDEPKVLFWHEIDAGFAGRRTIEDGFVAPGPEGK